MKTHQWRSRVMSSLQLERFCFFKRGLFRNKSAMLTKRVTFRCTYLYTCEVVKDDVLKKDLEDHFERVKSDGKRAKVKASRFFSIRYTNPATIKRKLIYKYKKTTL